MEKESVSAVKGKNSEDKLFKVLTNHYPEAEIEETRRNTASGDFRLKRVGKKDILIENKDYTCNVGT